MVWTLSIFKELSVSKLYSDYEKMSRRLADGEQNGARPYNNFAIPQPSTTRSISDGFARLFMMSETLSLKGKVLTRIMQLYWIVSPK